MKYFKIKIPKPCHKGWDNMTPNEKGRFCDSCCKTVVDFTKKSNAEIKEYFLVNRGNKICGHFKKKQLDSIVIQIPNEVFKSPLSFQKFFLLALLLTMGSMLFSCKLDGGRTQKIDKVEILVEDGYDEKGFDDFGFNINGYDEEGFDENGADKDGYDENGFDENGFDQFGFDFDGCNEDRYDEDGNECDVVIEGEAEAIDTPEIPPKYQDIKVKMKKLLSNRFGEKIEGLDISINISIDYLGKNGRIYHISGGSKEIQKKIKTLVKFKIIPLIAVAVKKNIEYDYFEYNYKLSF